MTTDTTVKKDRGTTTDEVPDDKKRPSSHWADGARERPVVPQTSAPKNDPNEPRFVLGYN